MGVPLPSLGETSSVLTNVGYRRTFFIVSTLVPTKLTRAVGPLMLGWRMRSLSREYGPSKITVRSAEELIDNSLAGEK